MTAPLDKQPGYRLKLEPDGRSRENLVDILERALLGPAGGPEEILDGVPDVAYLVGRIAPVRLTAGLDDPQDADAGEAATDVGDALDAGESRGVPVTAVDDSGAGADEDTVEDEPPKRGLMIPASMGLRYQIPDDLDSFTVTASWARRYQRTPIKITKAITVADLIPGNTTTIHLRDTVVLRIDRHDDTGVGRRLIEVALCNDREAPRKIPVNAWLYQTKLSVAAGGAEVFLPVTDALTDTRFERDDELRRLQLQYRDRLEFAIGRTCSVDWMVADGARRASEVWTTWLPTCQTPQTTAEEIDEALLDMTVLATASPAQLRAGLAPIITSYQSWLDGQQRQADALPEHLRGEGRDAVSEARKVARQLADGLEHLLSGDEALRCFRFMNQVMADQRIQSQVAQLRAANPKLGIDQARDAVLAEGPKAHSWRTFQLAFVLMQLPLLTDPGAQKRSAADQQPRPESPTTSEVAVHLRPATVLRTKEFDGSRVRNHAKFVAIDHRFLLVTSANFSWSAEHNNIEFGVLIDNRNLTEAVEREMLQAEELLYESIKSQ